ncbi:MAG TPA: SDR family oxidoreductase [Ramlibacter sp.]|nr:SDR family oxidoreductase [Ramlibacter sp.]
MTGVAWITGAGSGIGRACAVALAREGHAVAISGRRLDALETVAEEVRQAGGRVLPVPLDVGSAPAVAQAAARIAAELGPVRLLVNCAGMNVAQRAWDNVSAEGWQQVVDTNLNGTFSTMHAVLPGMRERRDGLVINIGSWAGRYPAAFVGPAYSATKHALVALTYSFNQEEAVHGLRACVIMPGEVATPILRHRPVPVPEAELALMLQAEDVAEAVLYVARTPARVCVNEILISPTRNRILGGAGDLTPKG